MIVNSDNVPAKQVSGTRSQDRRFRELVFGPGRSVGDEFIVEGAQFVNCQIFPGEFVIHGGVLLRNVLFDNVSSADAMIVSSNSVFDHVIIAGRPENGSLWIRPDEVFDENRDKWLRRWVKQTTESIHVLLDISNYWGSEVTVLGWPVEKIMFNPNRHMVFRSAWNREVDWSKLNIDKTSYWRSRLRYLRVFDVDEGIFSLPLQDDHEFERTMNERDRLRNLGIL